MNIIELAKEAGFDLIGNEVVESDGYGFITPELEAFAALVRAEREWVDLTDDEIHSIYEQHYAMGGCWTDGFDYEHAVIAAFKEKNK